MQITLNHVEIEEAIIEYVGSQGITINGKATEVTMVAGRGTNGYSATVDIYVRKPEEVDAKDPAGKITTSVPIVEFSDDDDGDTVEADGENLFGA